MPDFVRVTNEDSKPFIYHFNSSKKVIPPGRDAMMPWSLACSLFGDPFLVDAPKKPDRTDALRRARGNFNYELGMETMEMFMNRLPRLRVTDMETMQEMHMLLFDPEGQYHANYVAPDIDSADPVSLLTQQVQMLTQQLQMVLASQQSGQRAPLEGNLPMVTTDAPAQVMPGSVAQPQHQPQPQHPGAEWIGGNAFAQRPEDQGAPMFDFAAIATQPTSGPVPDGMPVDPSNPGDSGLVQQAMAPSTTQGTPPATPPATPGTTDGTTDGLVEDRPQDVGVGSGSDPAAPAPATTKLAPKPRKS